MRQATLDQEAAGTANLQLYSYFLAKSFSIGTLNAFAIAAASISEMPLSPPSILAIADWSSVTPLVANLADKSFWLTGVRWPSRIRRILAPIKFFGLGVDLGFKLKMVQLDIIKNKSRSYVIITYNEK